MPPVVPGLAAKARLAATNVLSLAINLPLRNQGELDELLHQLYDPASTNFHKFLGPQGIRRRVLGRPRRIISRSSHLPKPMA